MYASVTGLGTVRSFGAMRAVYTGRPAGWR